MKLTKKSLIVKRDRSSVLMNTDSDDSATKSEID